MSIWGWDYQGNPGDVAAWYRKNTVVFVYRVVMERRCRRRKIDQCLIQFQEKLVRHS